MPNFSGVWNLKDQVQAIAAGRWTGIPLYELYAWGSNNGGRLGDGTVVYRSSPVQIGSLTTWSQVSAGGNFSAAIKSDNTLWTWGVNNGGQLGLGDRVDRSSPVQVGASTDWAQVSSGEDFFSAVKTDGTLWGAGFNFAAGQIGDGTRVSRSSPVQVGALTNWLRAATGSDHNATLKTDGTIWSWGLGTVGQIGDGFALSRSSPVQIGLLTNWAQAATGVRHTISVKTDGTIWAWGSNLRGQIGDGTVVYRSSPVQIGVSTDWAVVGAGSENTAAIKTTGTLWAWGRNDSGEVGDNTILNRSSPVQVGALTNWSNVSGGAGGSTVAAIKTDGTLWAWGLGTSGQIGDNSVLRRSSPVQIGSLTSWYQVSTNILHTVAIYQGSSN